MKDFALTLFKGKLTYVVGFCMVVAGLYNGLVDGSYDLVLQGLGLLGLRRAFS